ncbi:alpha/beta fold hydrolase [Streptomyces sp. NPDC101206]|uniref:alpha/beta fold hydrolase n=1 Tax=Streptomyces sp. NPDC101206 TaxID=3366128 RepID=UPI00381DDADE
MRREQLREPERPRIRRLRRTARAVVGCVAVGSVVFSPGGAASARPGPAPSGTRTTEPLQAATPRTPVERACPTHTVVSGDRLSQLALRYLGGADRWPEIYEANQPALRSAAREHPGPPVFGTDDHGHWIFPGTALRIPGPCPAPTRPAGYVPAACPPSVLPGVPALGTEFSCGYLTVPENRAEPDGRTIRIAVARLRAAAAQPRPDPVVWLTGGPGGSGLLDALTVTRLKPAINADRDVIFVDQRGTGRSEPLLNCPEIDAFTRKAVTRVATDPETTRNGAAAALACRTRLSGSGHDLSAYDTTENAADIADLRTALGIEEWNVYGVSYGTDLALQLLRDHPQGIRSTVLDSVVAPHLNLLEGLWTNAADQYGAVFAACAAQPACRSAYPDLRAEFNATVQRLDRRPLTVTVPGEGGAPDTTVVIDGYQLANMVVVAALPPWALTTVPAAIHALAAGNGLPAARTILAGQSPPGFVGWGLFYGVVCREQAAFTDRRKLQAAAAASLPDLPERVLSLLPQQEFVSRILSDCQAWDVGRADPGVSAPTRSDVPTLLMSGSFDGPAGTRWATAAATGLTRSRHLVFPGLGHAVFDQSDCARAILVSFLDRPSGGYDTSCADTLTVPPFRTD